MQLTESDLTAIRSNPDWRAHRIAKVYTSAGPVLVKGQRPGRGPLRFKIMSALARLTRIPAFRPVPSPGGAAAQEIELKRLRSLSQAGVPVPKVLHTDAEFQVMEFVEGETLQALLRRQSADSLLFFKQGALAIQEVHRNGHYLSQAFARNILVSRGRCFFIDFEDDPLQAMSLPDAQARDWLAYLLSAVWVSSHARESLSQAWVSIVKDMQPEVRLRVEKTARNLAWLRHLPKKRKPWGRDVVTVQAMANFMHQWKFDSNLKIRR